MPPSLHSVLGASSAHRWLACTPSARLGEKLDNRFGKKSSPFAAEGTKAHELGEIKIRNALYHADGMTVSKLSRMSKTARDAYEGINDNRYKALREALGEIPDDMEHATDSYCDIVMEKLLRARESDPSTQILLEQRLDYSRFVPSGFGTGDCIIVSDSLLEVIDYKHGKGIPVSALQNPQLRLYSLGAIDRFGQLYDFDNVRYTIIQPRLDSVSEDSMTITDLIAWAETEVVEKAKQAWAGTGEFHPGEHCRFCSAKAVCAARVAKSLELFNTGLEAVGVISDEQVAEILPMLNEAEAWIKDIKAYAENQALKGIRIKGYKLVQGKKPNRQWSDTEEVEATLLRAGYPIEDFRETKLKPVGQVEKALGKTAFRALLDGLVYQGEGKPTLVPEDDRRIEISAADTAFADLLEN